MAPAKTSRSDEIPDHQHATRAAVLDDQHRDDAWGQIAQTLRDDWEQTQSQVFPTDRDRDRPQLSWAEAEPALRFGHEAVTRYPDDALWSSDLEARLKNDWASAERSMEWDRASHMVRYGWDYRRKRML